MRIPRRDIRDFKRGISRTLSSHNRLELTLGKRWRSNRFIFILTSPLQSQNSTIDTNATSTIAKGLDGAHGGDDILLFETFGAIVVLDDSDAIFSRPRFIRHCDVDRYVVAYCGRFRDGWCLADSVVWSTNLPMSWRGLIFFPPRGASVVVDILGLALGYFHPVRFSRRTTDLRMVKSNTAKLRKVINKVAHHPMSDKANIPLEDNIDTCILTYCYFALIEGDIDMSKVGLIMADGRPLRQHQVPILKDAPLQKIPFALLIFRIGQFLTLLMSSFTF